MTGVQTCALPICGERRAVEIAVELGPLVETTVVDQSFELVTLNEDILVTLLTRALRTCGPRPAQPDVGVALNNGPRDRSLTNPARADENKDGSISDQGFEIVQPVALVRDHEFDGIEQCLLLA